MYADTRHAALVTFDREFSRRRRKYPIGRHIWMRCAEPRAAEVFQAHLPDVLEYLHREHVTIEVSVDEIRATSRAD